MDDPHDEVMHSHVELNRGFVDEVGEATARQFVGALQRAHARVAGSADHDRAREIVEEEVAATGVRLAAPEVTSYADQLMRFDRLEFALPGELPSQRPDPLADDEGPDTARP